MFINNKNQINFNALTKYYLFYAYQRLQSMQLEKSKINYAMQNYATTIYFNFLLSINPTLLSVSFKQPQKVFSEFELSRFATPINYNFLQNSTMINNLTTSMLLKTMLITNFFAHKNVFFKFNPKHDYYLWTEFFLNTKEPNTKFFPLNQKNLGVFFILSFFLKKKNILSSKIKAKTFNHNVYLSEFWYKVKMTHKRRIRRQKVQLDMRIKHKKRKKIVKRIKKKHLTKLLKIKRFFYKTWAKKIVWRLKSVEKTIQYRRSLFWGNQINAFRFKHLIAKTNFKSASLFKKLCLKKRALKIKCFLLRKKNKKQKNAFFIVNSDKQKISFFKQVMSKRAKKKNFKKKKNITIIKWKINNSLSAKLKRLKLKKKSRIKRICFYKSWIKNALINNSFKKANFSMFEKTTLIKLAINDVAKQLNTSKAMLYVNFLTNSNSQKKNNHFNNLKKVKTWFPKSFKRKYIIEKKLSKRVLKIKKTKFLKTNFKTAQALTNYFSQKISTTQHPFNLFNYSSAIQSYCYFQLQKQLSQFYLKYFAIYFVGFFEFFVKKQVYLTWYTNHCLVSSVTWLVNYIALKYNYLRSKISTTLFLKELLPVLFHSFDKKDLTYINTWLKINIERFPIKKHKTFIFHLKMILTTYFGVFKKLFKIKGFFLDIRGKLSVTGNAKKRHAAISLGNFNKSNRKLKIDWKQNVIRTNTGVLGLTLLLTY